MIRSLTVFTLMFALAVPGLAEDKEKKKPKKKKDLPLAAAKLFSLPETIELSDDQTAKMAELRMTYAPKFQEAIGQMRSALSPETIKARAAARKKALSEGAKRKDLMKAINEAAPLTDAEKKAVEESRATMRQLQQEVRGKIRGMLTEDQLAKLPKMRGGKKADGEKKPNAAKKAKADKKPKKPAAE